MTNIRKKLDAALTLFVPNSHHAHSPLHPVPRILNGHTDGIQYPDTGIQVNHANIGIPTDGLISWILRGIPKILGEPPGASGAQLSGEFRHDPPPNPHESQLAISSAA